MFCQSCSRSLVRRCLFVSILTLLFTPNILAAATPTFGRFVGVLNHDKLQMQQLVKLDFVVSRQDGNELQMMALLSLYFGDFNSAEYITYHFDDVRYNLISGALVFDQLDQDTTVIVNNFGGDRLEGDFRSAIGGNIGRLVLSKDPQVETTLPLLQPTWGEYRGLCDGYSTILQIQSFRSIEDTSRVGNPFGTYDIHAQLAEDDPQGCMGEGTSCVKQVFESSSYNFYSGTLNLYSRGQSLTCQVGATGLLCGQCTLKRYSKEAASGTSFTFPTSTPGWTESLPPNDGDIEVPAEGLQGEYAGYVHHEYNNTYQDAKINLVAYQQPNRDTGKQELHLSAVATLAFGATPTEETISYRFSDETYNLLAPQIVLDNIAGDTDAILQITELGSGAIRGVWYSLIFGRVGTFILKKSGAVALPEDARRMTGVAGRYASRHYALDLQVGRGSAPINTRNPFFPLSFEGFIRLDGVGANRRISGGSFDFYTGKIAFFLEEADIVFAGLRPDRQTILLKKPNAGLIRPLQSHQFEEFNLLGN